MRYAVIAISASLFALAATGCSIPATDSQLEGMCRNHLELKGDLRGTSEEEEVGRIEEEYAVKEKNLKSEMARDLKGMDDVLEQALKDLETAEITPTEEDEGKTVEQLKEELKKSKTASIEEKKKPIIEQFERLLKVLGLQKKVQVDKAREYAAKNKEKADKAHAECVAAAKKKGIFAETADCRIRAKSLDDYDACK